MVRTIKHDDILLQQKLREHCKAIIPHKKDISFVKEFCHFPTFSGLCHDCI